MLKAIVIALGILYFLYVIFERIYYFYLRKKIKLVIHVNGIRGKSTTTRLIDAGLRECGYRVFSKTTGTIPTIINTSNVDKKIFRLGNANIREQLKMLRHAVKEKADVLVIECMAVNPELQKISEEKILKANITVITNIRLDHISDMGDDLSDIAKAFMTTIPKNGTLIIPHTDFDYSFIREAKTKKTKVCFAEEYKGDSLETFEENIALSFEVCNVLHLDKEKYFSGMKKYHHDEGAYQEIRYGKTLFLNGFSINDPLSIKLNYDKIIKKYNHKEITILLNSRYDRPYRVMQHIEMIGDLKCKKVILFGSNSDYIYRKLKKTYKDYSFQKLKKIEDLVKEDIVFAVGNIGGKGLKILEYFKENGVSYE